MLASPYEQTSLAAFGLSKHLRYVRNVMASALEGRLGGGSERGRGSSEEEEVADRWQRVGRAVLGRHKTEAGPGGAADAAKSRRRDKSGGRALRRSKTCPVEANAAFPASPSESKNAFEILRDLKSTAPPAAANAISAKQRRKIKRQVTHFPLSSANGRLSATAAAAAGPGASATDDAPEATASSPDDGYTHLCVLVHGLGGTPGDWTAVSMEFEKALEAAEGGDGAPNRGADSESGGGGRMLVHVSEANTFLKTFDGIDVCGARLAEEIKLIVRSKPSLKTLSIVGHSLGGLIARYALGVMYCQETGTMFGLRPRHFATIVSPHLGCDGSRSTENEVPFLGYLTGIPILGAGIGIITNIAAAPGAALLYRRTGRQLFLRDTDASQDGLPIVFQLAVNGLSEEIIDYHYTKSLGLPARAQKQKKRNLLPFGKALAAFKSRTLYSNIQGDHMVSWPNASIRKVSEIPIHLFNAEAHGIVAESNSQAGPRKPKGRQPGGGVRRKMTIDVSSHKRLQDLMIESLQKVAWRRVDVKLEMGATKLPHNYIQLRPADEHSLSVTKHLMKVLSN